MDYFSQETRITSYHPLAPRIVQMSLKVGAEGTYSSAPKKAYLTAESGTEFENWSAIAIGRGLRTSAALGQRISLSSQQEA
jgi:hypothetical protein